MDFSRWRLYLGVQRLKWLAERDSQYKSLRFLRVESNRWLFRIKEWSADESKPLHMARLPPFAQGGSPLRLTCSLFSFLQLPTRSSRSHLARCLGMSIFQVRGESHVQLATDGSINHSTNQYDCSMLCIQVKCPSVGDIQLADTLMVGSLGRPSEEILDLSSDIR